MNNTTQKNEIETQDFVSDFYETVRYEKWYSWVYQSWWFKKMVDLVELPRGGLILDNGCGTGHLAEFVKEKIVGLDVSGGMLKLAKQRLSRLVNASAESLPFKNEMFDCVFARALLHHLPHPERGVAEIERVLKPGGRVIFCDTLYSVLSALPRKVVGGGEHFSEEHKNFKESELLILIEPHLKIEKIVYFGYIAYPLLGFPDIFDVFKYFPFKKKFVPLLIKIDEIIASIPVLKKQAWGVLVVARKK